MTVEIQERFKIRGGLKAALVALNEVPLRRELIVELDNLFSTGEFDAKIGDGTTNYVNLPYLQVSGGSGGGSGGGDSYGVTVLTPASGAVNIDLSLGKYFTITLTANVTSITFANIPASGFGTDIEIFVAQDSAGSHSFVLPVSFASINADSYSVDMGPNAVTIIRARTVDQGATWPFENLRIVSPSANRRFWRVYLTENNGAYAYYQISKLNFHATVGGSNLCVGGAAYSTTSYGGTDPASVFGAADGRWLGGDDSLNNVPPPPGSWIAYDLPANAKVNEILMVGTQYDGDLTKAPKSFIVQSSSDSTDGSDGTWYDEWSVGGQTGWTADEVRLFARPGV